MKASELLSHLRARGIQFRLMPDGEMRYKDCEGVLTAHQDAYVQQHRQNLAALLLAEQSAALGLEEDIAEHLPDDMRLPCWGRFRACQEFTPSEMAPHAASSFATVARHRRDACGDCTLFHAHFDLIERTCKREEAEAKRVAAEKMQARIRRRYYADQQEQEEQV